MKILSVLKDLRSLYRESKIVDKETNLLLLYVNALYYYIFFSKKILAHQKVKIKGIKNIESNQILKIGVDPVGFSHKSELTYLNIEGKLVIKEMYSIGRGCRFDIGKDAIVILGGGYITANTNLIIMHELIIGNNCSISWDCQFLDEDFHNIDYQDKKISDNSIRIGDNVWIGCGVKIYKGVVIPDNCVIAADSILKGKFYNKNTLIGGNPAIEIKNNINWH
jgi:acetyltransferase-like isoleucine patch superfamily enzyme